VKNALLSLALFCATPSLAENLAPETTPIIQISVETIMADFNGCLAGQFFDEDTSECLSSSVAEVAAEEEY
jgi:hypothetical protein